MNYLVIGASGMVGHTISLYLTERGHTVTGLCRRPFDPVETVTGDALDEHLVRKIVDNNKIDVVVNAAGVLNFDAEKNPDRAILINSYLPHKLSQMFQNDGPYLIHLSTDCVFSGREGGYTEASFPDGSTVYDKSKALGELRNLRSLTLRNSIIGPDINPEGIGLFNWFMAQSNIVNGYTKVIWTGLTTCELAKVIEAASKSRPTGLVNMVNNSAISKFELLKLFNNTCRACPLEIVPNPGLECDKSLIRTNFNFEYQIPQYETMINEMYSWIKRHASLYAHYNEVLK